MSFELNPGAPEAVLHSVMWDLGGTLPRDYQAFMSRCNDGVGYLGEVYLHLWRVEDL
jgi:hypothetical protein